MSRARELPQAIQWHEGMLLCPQHFQESSARSEALVQYHVSAAAPYHWGIVRLRVDDVLLSGGTFRVTELEAVMPDGLVLEHGVDRDEPLELDLADSAALMADVPQAIHLAVPISNRSAEIGQIARYDTVPGRPIADLNTGSSELDIPRLRPRPRLLLSESPATKYVSFPLAKVIFRNERFSQVNFVPPMLAVSSEDALVQRCRAIAKTVRKKAIALAEKARSPALGAGTPLLMETRGQVQALVAGLPHFEAILEAGVSHPFDLYLSACNLLGQISSMGTQLIPPALEAYNHNDLVGTFEPVLSHLDKVLAEIIQDVYNVLPLVEDERGNFEVGFFWMWATRRLVLGARARQGATEASVSAWMDSCLIASKDKIPTLREKRIRGAQRIRVERDPDLVPVPGVVHYEVTFDPNFIDTGEVLKVMQSDSRNDADAPSEIVLYVKAS